MKYELEKRLTSFSKTLILYLREIKLTYLNKNIIDQLLRSGTSVGANYCEANGASSKKDFRNKIMICKKEIQETKYWLELLVELLDEKEKSKLRKIYQEAKELSMIFGKISSTLSGKK